jgi:dTDP-4-dehydrorhamnose reductase
MRILITGGKGQLGSDCAEVLGRSYEVMAMGSAELDITDPLDVDTVISRFSPEIILNCAAYTQVDACETEKDLAWRVNAKGPENLALSVKKHGGRLVHISTDYVFDGSKKLPEAYLEEDRPNPMSRYGKSKLEGEKAVRKTTERHIILRTAWLYGVNGHNFLKTMLKLALRDSSEPIKVVNDQFGSPTWSYRLAIQLSEMIEGNAQGTFHATAEGHCSWYELALYFLEKMEVAHSIVPCTSDEYPTPAVRPKNSILENRRLKIEGIHLMTDWQTDVEQFVRRFRKRLIEEHTDSKEKVL